jgi:hypothetical protein
LRNESKNWTFKISPQDLQQRHEREKEGLMSDMKRELLERNSLEEAIEEISRERDVQIAEVKRDREEQITRMRGVLVK